MVMILLASFAFTHVIQCNSLPFATRSEGRSLGMASRIVVTTGAKGPGIEVCAVGRKTTSGRTTEVESAMPPRHQRRVRDNIRVSCTLRKGDAKPFVAQLSFGSTNPWNLIPGVVVSANLKHPLS